MMQQSTQSAITSSVSVLMHFLTAEASAERALHPPNHFKKAAINTSTMPSDILLPQQQAVCCSIAVSRRERTRSFPAEDEFLQLITEFHLLSDNTSLQAEKEPQPQHLVKKRITFAFFDNSDAALGVTKMARTASRNLGSTYLLTAAPTSCASTERWPQTVRCPL